jgi:hypothetical protein
VTTKGVKKRCRLSWLTNSALVYEHKCGGGEGGVEGSQPMRTAVHRKPNKLWCSVADPDPNPPDPHVFGPPGSGSIS